MTKKLSKSNYLIGLECPKMLWTIFNHPEKKPKLSKFEQFKLAQGIKVGQLAKQLYRDGIDITSMNEAKYLEISKEFLKERKPLFEAGFEFDNCLSRVDILLPVDGGWELIEVKSSTKVKDINLHDVSFQKYIYEAIGLEIKGSYLLHLNKEYVRKGELDLEQLFIKEDISSEVDDLLVDIKKRIATIYENIELEEEPKPGILSPKVIKNGNHNCLSENCLDITENSVFQLYRGKKLACELYKEGIKTVGEIPDDHILTEKQNIQRDCEQKEEVYLNKEKVKEFLGELQYPIYYLDFETITTAIPMFDGVKPYTQVPFQFSLHIVKNEGSKPQHYEFLYDGCDDPRKEFLLELQKVLGDKGSIVVYYKSFEIGRLKELAEYFPEHKDWVEVILERIVDLHIPFKEFSYYNAKQKGSASLKAVLPAITDKSYNELDIAEGMTASTEFLRVTYDDCDPAEKEKIRRQLLSYCELDTLAQVNIVDKLQELVM